MLNRFGDIEAEMRTREVSNRDHTKMIIQEETGRTRSMYTTVPTLEHNVTIAIPFSLKTLIVSKRGHLSTIKYGSLSNCIQMEVTTTTMAPLIVFVSIFATPFSTVLPRSTFWSLTTIQLPPCLLPMFRVNAVILLSIRFRILPVLQSLHQHPPKHPPRHLFPIRNTRFMHTQTTFSSCKAALNLSIRSS